MPSGPSEPSPAPRPRPVSGLGFWLLAALVAGLAGWAVITVLRRQAEQVDTALPPGAGPAPAQLALPAPTNPSLLVVRVDVEMYDASGAQTPVGTPLPTRVTLELLGPDGTTYQARFDRVGIWALEAPPGELRVARSQTNLGRWKWSLAGADVRPATGSLRYLVTLARGESSVLTLELR